MNIGTCIMYYNDYTVLKAQQKVLQKAFKNGRLSEEVYNLKIKELEKIIKDYEIESQSKVKELNKKIKDYEMESQLRDAGVVVAAEIRNGHYVIDLNCPCGWEGTCTYGKLDAELLGKDRKGFIYFECPKCKRHLQYDPVTGKIRTKKGILGFLLGRFGL